MEHAKKRIQISNNTEISNESDPDGLSESNDNKDNKNVFVLESGSKWCAVQNDARLKLLVEC